jgi:predicted ferric reductase
VLAGVFHSVLLLDWNTSSISINLTIIALSVVGLWCSCLSLFGKIGKTNKVQGNVAYLEKYDNVVRFSVKLDNKLEYKEGQFAYLDFKDGESPHPFSVLNYDEENNTVSFGVKDLGDYTHNLVNNLKEGASVTVEGCYGQFQISTSSHQVWVGAGIGIVPFISRLYWLHQRSKTAANSYTNIVLYYCVNRSREAFFEKEIIGLLSKLDFIELHVLDAQRGELLNGEQIATKMAGKSYDVSFCGPESFGNSLQSYLTLTGLPDANFHKEIFKMR